MTFSEIFSPKTTIIDLKSTRKKDLFEEMVQAIYTENSWLNLDMVLQALNERERQMSTGIMHGIAIPHATCDFIDGCLGAIGISKKGIDYRSLDGEKVNLVFMLLFGKNGNDVHVEALRNLAMLLSNRELVGRLLEKTSAQDIYDTLCETEEEMHL